MKRLVIDGNSVYEIDLDCARRRKPPKGCELSQHLQEFQVQNEDNGKDKGTRKSK